MLDVWIMLFGWLPNAALRVIVAGLFAILCIFVILRIIKVVLDAIPFL